MIMRQGKEGMLYFKIDLILYICWNICSVIHSASSTNNETLDFTNNSSLTLSNILKTYDIRLRPNFGAQPLYIGMELIISSVEEFSEVNMDYTITISLNQYWKDDRLAFSSQDIMLPLAGDFAEKIWVPDTFFANDKNSFLHEVTEKNKMIRLYGDGSLAYGMRFTTTLICPMNLVSYPLDSQNCTVEIESYGYTTRDLYFYWKDVKGLEDISLHQYVISDYNMIDRLVELETGTYQRLSLSILFRRNIGSFIFQMYLPSVLIVMISWISFWINFDAPAARVALGITTILTLLISHNNVRSTLPKISYVKAIDIYLVTCFIFVFAALIEYAAVNYIYWEHIRKASIGKKVKKNSKWTFYKVLIRRKPCRASKDVTNNDQESSTKFSTSIFKYKFKFLKHRHGDNNKRATETHSPTTVIPKITSTLCSIEVNDEDNLSSTTNTLPTKEIPSRNLLSATINKPSHFDMSVPVQQKVIRSSSFCGSTGIHQHPRLTSTSTFEDFDIQGKQTSSVPIQVTRRKRFVQSIRRKAKRLENKLPQFTENVNHIDSFARVLFPISFILFNAIYWPYYIMTS